MVNGYDSTASCGAPGLKSALLMPTDINRDNTATLISWQPQKGRKSEVLMSKTLFKIIGVLLISAGFAANATADVNIGATFSEDGLKEFHLAIGDFYTVPEKEIIIVKEKGIPEDELPVVFYIASRASVSPNVVINLRLKGRSWMDISLHYGLGTEIYYINTKEDIGPPYGKALGHFKRHKRHEWGKIMLTDNEIVALVNLKFISTHYGYSPAKVAGMKAKNESFVKLNQKIKKDKNNKKQKAIAKSVKKVKGKKKGKK
jgi:hypothetical protein